jgi:hypothetical protein
MRRWPTIAGIVLVVVAIALALLASDVRSWQSGVRAGDLAFAANPAGARWTASTVLPSDPAQAVLGLKSQLAYRRAAQTFVAVNAAGCGFDNCYSEAQARGNLEGVLTGLATGSSVKRDALADNLLGILAFGDAKPSAANGGSAPIDQALEDFQASVRLDPANADAQYNLEWVLHQLAASNVTRHGNSQSASTASRQKGGGGSVPTSGF